MNDSNKSNTSHEIDEIVEENDEYEECSYIVEDEIITEGEVEEMVEESEIQEESPPFKKMRSEKVSNLGKKIFSFKNLTLIFFFCIVGKTIRPIRRSHGTC